MRSPARVKETKIFDPADGFAPFTNVVEITDGTVVKRGNRWWMFTAGAIGGLQAIQLSSASLPEDAPLSASGWKLTADPNDPTKIVPLAGQESSKTWDLRGGRHCPSYVRGWDPHRRQWVERIYYAGAAEFLWGPYTIGYLEWDGEKWLDQVTPSFAANEAWEHGSVYEPNLIYHDGKWKMWYVAGSNHEDYIVHGYSESDDGRTNWSNHRLFAPAEYKMFDFRVIEANGTYESVFSRVWLGKGAPPPETGLWWCRCDEPSSQFSDWSNPVQIMTAEDRGWHPAPGNRHRSTAKPIRIICLCFSTASIGGQETRVRFRSSSRWAAWKSDSIDSFEFREDGNGVAEATPSLRLRP